MTRNYVFLFCLFAGTAFATPTPPNPCGNHGNNCGPDTPTPVVTPTPVTVTPTINPVIAPTINPVVAPVIAPTTVVAPVIAPRNDVNVGVATSASVRNDVNVGVVNANNVRNEVSNAQQQAQQQAQHQGQQQGQTQTAQGGNATGGAATQAQDASNTNTVAPVQSLTYNEAAAPANVTIRTTPQVNAPGLASAINNDLCVVSASVGGSGVGFGFGIGLQYRDEDCVRRVNARQLFNFGLAKAAILLMATDPAVKDALTRAGDLKDDAVTLPLDQPRKLITNAPAIEVR